MIQQQRRQRVHPFHRFASRPVPAPVPCARLANGFSEVLGEQPVPCALRKPWRARPQACPGARLRPPRPVARPACARRMGLCRRARSFPPPPRPAGHMVAVRAFAVPRGGVSASRFAPVRAPARQARPARPAARPVRWIVPIISARAAVRQPPARRPAPAISPPSVRCASRADRFCASGPLSYAPSRGDSPACAMMLPPLHVRPLPRLSTPPPRSGQNPAVPAYFSHRSGPARGGSPPAPSCPARAAGRGKPPYFGRFCPVAAPPSGRAHSHKSIAKKWKIFMECSLQFLSIFTILFYNELSA